MLLISLVVPWLLWIAARRPGRLFAITTLSSLIAGAALAIAGPSIVVLDGGPKGSIGFSSWVLAATVAVVGVVLAACRADGRPGSLAIGTCMGLSCFIHYAGFWIS